LNTDDRKHNIVNLLLENLSLFYLIGLVGIANGFVLPFLKVIHASITHSYFMTAIGEALFIFSLASMGIIWGFAFDIAKERRVVIIFALEVIAFFVFITSEIRSSIGYVLVRFLTGFFGSSIYAYIMKEVSYKYRPGQRITVFFLALLLMNFFLGAGSAIAIVLTLWTHWRAVIRIYAFVLGLGALLAFPFLGSNPALISRKGEQEVGGLLRFFVMGWSEFAKKKTNRLLAIQGIFGCIPWGALGLFGIYAIMERMNVDFLFVGTLAAMASIGYYFASLIFPYLDKIRRREEFKKLTYIVAISIFLQAILYILSLLLPPSFIAYEHIYTIGDLISSPTILLEKPFVSFIILFATLYFVSSIPGPVTRNIVSDINSYELSGSALMILRFFENLGQSLGLIIAGYIVEKSGSFWIPLILLTLFWFVCGAIWIPIGSVWEKEQRK